jgi:hypothetical protein
MDGLQSPGMHSAGHPAATAGGEDDTAAAVDVDVTVCCGADDDGICAAVSVDDTVVVDDVDW